jgi:hypothetical protein
LGGGQGHIVGRLDRVFKTHKVIIHPAGTVAPKADFLHGLLPFHLLFAIDQMFMNRLPGQFRGQGQSDPVLNPAGMDLENWEN